MINSTQISVKLSRLPIQQLALICKFSVHANVKITSLAYVCSFFMMLSKGQNTLRCWSGELSCILNKVVSKKGH